MDDPHRAAVERIRSSIAQFYEAKRQFRVYHGSTNSTRHANFQHDAIVDVSSLNRVIHIDTEKKTALVEPNVPMDALVQETKRVGLLPPVVMEFPGITVGGGFVGTAGESSSFKHGFFDRTVLSAEVILADGRLVTASETSNVKLFNGLRGSFGTLGVLTLVELKLIDAKKYVEVTYQPTTSIDNAMSKLDEESKNKSHDYLDGILFSRTSGAIISGRLTDSSPSTFNFQRFSRPWDQWFYIHAENVTKHNKPHTELVPVEDYLFRYDRGAFWTGKYAFQYFLTPFNRLTRFLLNYFMHTRIMYHALHASGHTDHYLIQDLAIPTENAATFTHFLDERFNLYPLWLCPLRSDTRSSMGHPQPYHSKISNKEYTSSYISIGVWGPGPTSEPEFVKTNRDLEARCAELGGLKWLYARVFYTENEFWQIYDEEGYLALREKFNATSLPSVWDKMRDRGRGKKSYGTGVKGVVKRVVMGNGFLSGIYGVWKAWRGGDYLIAKKKT
ncbi:hypothetical protein B0J11DRAFT_534822 [Dendryphion nanum]|uniref:Delta(24)-sterol reductase n=1 Tax=Dendryphion nanum TaxID=256645 RepID=A0A9P9IFG1_9PLEO|nr:hypothetical protein B0J11DRAFT_534822 [Dendryphion nanum]